MPHFWIVIAALWRFNDDLDGAIGFDRNYQTAPFASDGHRLTTSYSWEDLTATLQRRRSRWFLVTPERYVRQVPVEDYRATRTLVKRESL